MTTSPVLACGGLTLDWVQDAGGMHGPTPGGNALYSGTGAWLTGAAVELVAVAGSDYPAHLLARLDEAGLGTRGVRAVDTASFRVLLAIDGPDRQISYLPGSGSNRDLDPVPTQLTQFEDAAGAHIAAIPVPSQDDLVTQLVETVPVVTLDTVHIPRQIEPDREALLAVARRCSAFVPSREEVHYLWPGADVEAALPTMSDIAAPLNVIKLGAAGSLGFDGQRSWRVPAYPTQVIDVTGAGDAFCGALCARLAAGDDLLTSMCWAAAAASLIIEAFGCLDLLDTRRQRDTAERAEKVFLVTGTTRRDA